MELEVVAVGAVEVASSKHSPLQAQLGHQLVQAVSHPCVRVAERLRDKGLLEQAHLGRLAHTEQQGHGVGGAVERIQPCVAPNHLGPIQH